MNNGDAVQEREATAVAPGTTALVFEATVAHLEPERKAYPSLVTVDGREAVVPASYLVGEIFPDANGRRWRVVRNNKDDEPEGGFYHYFFRIEAVTDEEGAAAAA